MKTRVIQEEPEESEPQTDAKVPPQQPRSPDPATGPAPQQKD